MARKSNSFKNIIMLLAVLLPAGALAGTEAVTQGALPGINAGESSAAGCDYFGHKSVITGG